MKKLLIAISALASVVIFSGCTANERAKHFGGTMEVQLQRGEKLVDVTWKKKSLWYMTKPMTVSDVAETYTFREESSLGIMQGKVIFIESK